MKELFRRLTKAEMTRLLKEAHSSTRTVLVKFESSPVFKLKANPVAWGANVSCTKIKALDERFKGKEATCNFILDGEIYFFKAKPVFENKNVHLNLVSDLFHLFRRRNRRLQIPDNFKAQLTTKRINGKLVFLRAPLKDITHLGCKVVLNSEVPKIQSGDVIEGALRIGTRHPLEIKGIVRHKKEIKKDHFDQVFGLEFSETEGSDQNRLMTLILELERELFIRSF